MTAQKRILLVDEDAAMRESMAQALTLENYQVVAAANGREAFQKASATIFDVTVFDLDLPDQHRWQTVRHVTATNPASRKIGMTARRDQSALADTADLDALLEKPFQVDLLLKAIKQMPATVA